MIAKGAARFGAVLPIGLLPAPALGQFFFLLVAAAGFADGIDALTPESGAFWSPQVPPNAVLTGLGRVL